MAKNSNQSKGWFEAARKRVLGKQMSNVYDATANIDDPVELYAVTAAGWKKGDYTDRDFDAVQTEIQIDKNGVVHMLLKKSFGGYNGDKKFTERVLDIKFDSISVERLQEFFNSVEEVD